MPFVENKEDIPPDEMKWWLCPYYREFATGGLLDGLHDKDEDVVVI